MLLGRRLSPILFGSDTKLDDIYALVIGGYVIGLFFLITTAIFTEFVGLNVKHALQVGLIRLTKWIYLTLVAGILLPLLCSICIRLYVMDPIQRLISGTIIEMMIMEEWALGVIHFEIAGWIIVGKI